MLIIKLAHEKKRKKKVLIIIILILREQINVINNKILTLKSKPKMSVKPQLNLFIIL